MKLKLGNIMVSNNGSKVKTLQFTLKLELQKKENLIGKI